MLTRAERDLVIAKLVGELIQGAAAQNTVSGLFGGVAIRVLPAIPTGAPTHAVIANAVLDACLLDRRALDPSLLEVLLTGLITAGAADLTTIRERVRQRIDPNLDVLETSWINANLPFFGRTEGRAFVRALPR